MSVMTPEDRIAAGKYGRSLEAQFEANQTAMRAARDAGNREEYLSRSDRSKSLYREIEEVATALQCGALPPYSDSEIKRGEALKAWRDAVRRKHQQAANTEIERTQAHVETRIDTAISAGNLIDVEWELICDSQAGLSEVPTV